MGTSPPQSHWPGRLCWPRRRGGLAIGDPPLVAPKSRNPNHGRREDWQHNTA
jgi:hypothetical protein